MRIAAGSGVAGQTTRDMTLSPLISTAGAKIASSTLAVETTGTGLVEITDEVARFVTKAAGRHGAVLMFVRHTSASLVIQENADPDVRVDLVGALDRLAPADAPWLHTTEGPDDMPAHAKAMLTGVTLHVPVIDGKLALGTWQGIYLAEHRSQPHRREVVLQFLGQ